MRLILVIFFLILNTLYAKQDPVGVGDRMIDGNYIGGFYLGEVDQVTSYNKYLVSKKSIEVGNVGELLKAVDIAMSGTVIFLKGNSSFDLSEIGTIRLRAGVTLSSDRGMQGSLGALVYSNNLNTNPMFSTSGGNIQINGIRFRGPDAHIVNFRSLSMKFPNTSNEKLENNATYGIPNSSFIHIHHANVRIENCEIYNWSHAGIFVRKNGKASIHHNYIHHNQRKGLGYGIMVDNGFAKIRANIFDFNRHAIAGTGTPETSFEASYNIALSNSMLQGHTFDMHGGEDRQDKTDIAGKQMLIFNNLFYVSDAKPVVLVRGRPRYKSMVKNNLIIIKGRELNRNNLNVFFRQINSQGNFDVYNNGLRREF